MLKPIYFLHSIDIYDKVNAKGGGSRGYMNTGSKIRATAYTYLDDVQVVFDPFAQMPESFLSSVYQTIPPLGRYPAMKNRKKRSFHRLYFIYRHLLPHSKKKFKNKDQLFLLDCMLCFLLLSSRLVELLDRLPLS